MDDHTIAIGRYLNYAKAVVTHCYGDWTTLCLEVIDWNFGGILLEIVIFLFCLILMGKIVDERLVPSLEALSDKWHLKEDVAGATLLAIGSSAPDIVISCITSFQGGDSMEMGVGSIFGSGLIAFLILSSLSALFAPAILYVKRRALVRDFCFYVVILLFLYIFISDQKVTILESIGLIFIYIIYVFFLFYFPQLKQLFCRTACRSKEEVVLEEEDANPLEIQEIVEKKKKKGRYSKTLMVTFLSKCMVVSKAKRIEANWYGFWSLVGKIFTVPCSYVIEYAIPKHEKQEGVFSYIALATMLISFLFIAVSSFLLTTVVGRWIELIEQANEGVKGLSSLMGMTVVAFASAVPDTLQAINVAKKGFGSMAVASALGSLIINIGIGIGLPYFIIACSNGLGYVPFGALAQFNSNIIYMSIAIIVFFVLTIGCVIVFKQEKVQLDRKKGLVLLLTYILIILFYGLQVCGII